jgi:hypothetical protein
MPEPRDDYLADPLWGEIGRISKAEEGAYMPRPEIMQMFHFEL